MTLKFLSLEEEFKKNKDLKREDLQSLLEWNHKQQHLPNLSMEHLVLFLQSCYFRCEAAKTAIENYFTIRSSTPEIFANIDMGALETIMDTLLVVPLPIKTPEGYHVLYVRLLDTNLDKYDPTLAKQYFDMVCNLVLSQHGTANGHILVVDATGSSIAHALKLNIVITRKFIFYLQEALPVRVKSIHVINALPFIDKVLQMFKYIIKQDILNVLHIHSKMDTFYPFVQQELLPEELGGKAGTFERLKDEMVLNVKRNEPFFKALEKLKVDDSKRLPKSQDELSIEGTFKKLEID